MIALLYLKHAFNESDEGVVQRWSETGVDPISRTLSN
jgi:hypothetical protein